MSIAGKTCLVLGGGGFIGTNLCRALLAAGARVDAYGRRPRHRGLDDRVRWHDGAFADAARIATIVRGRDLVFHLLGDSVPAQSNDDPIDDVERSLLPSLRLIEACRLGGVGRLLFVSSGGTVYGVTGAAPVAETAPTEPITAYGINKLAVEKYLGLNRHLHGFDSIVLRPSNPYGPFQHARRAQGLVGTMLAKAIAGETIEIWGDGSVVRDFLHVDDLVDAMIAAACHRGPGRVFNVGSGTGRSVREVADAVVAATGIDPARIRHRPGRRADVPVNILDTGLIRREMGWAPRIGWREGLASTTAWMRDAAAGATS